MDNTSKGFLKKMHRKDIPADAIVLPSRFVYAIKNARTLDELYKSRYTTGGHCDIMKIMMIHDSANIRHGSIRPVASTAAKKEWIVCTKDATQAYIQGEDLTIFIVLIPPPELELPPGIVLKVCKYFYGLSEAGDAWHHKLRREVTSKLQMSSLAGDHALYMRGNLIKSSDQKRMIRERFHRIRRTL